MTKASVILHLADLRFGEHHRWSMNFSEEKKRLSLSKLLCQDLKEYALPNDLIPDVVVVSGDIVDEPTDENYKLGKEFLLKILEVINQLREKVGKVPISKKNFIIVPGNTDIDWKKECKNDRFAPFYNFLKSFYGANFLNSESSYQASAEDYLFRVDNYIESNIIVLALNPWLDPDKAEGIITDHQIKTAAKSIDSLVINKQQLYDIPLKIAVIYDHKIVPPVDYSSRVSEDVNDSQTVLIDILQQHEFDIVFIGHKRNASALPIFSESYGVNIWKSIVVICAGSAGANDCDSYYELIKITPGNYEKELWNVDIRPRIIPVSEENQKWRSSEKHQKVLSVDVHPKKLLPNEAVDYLKYVTQIIREYRNIDTIEDRITIIDAQHKYGLAEYYVEPACIEPTTGTIFDPMSIYIKDWINLPQHNKLVVLGDYGSGKTSFCWNLCYQMAVDYQRDSVNSRIPIVISLRKRGPIENVILFVLKYLEELDSGSPATRFRHLLEEGKFLIIFDGFDELDSNISEDNILSNWNELVSLGVGRSKIIITCRMQFFKSKTHLESVLHRDIPLLGRSDTYDVIQIQDWSIPKIEQYLEKHWKGDWKYYWTRAISSYNSLAYLARRPLFLMVMIAYVPDLFKRPEGISLEGIFERYVQYILRREAELAAISQSVKAAILEQVALTIYLQVGKNEIDGSNLMGLLEEYFSNQHVSDITLEKYCNDLRSSGFLIRHNGCYTFFNEYFMSFFAAKKLAKEIREHKVENFSKRLLDESCAIFLSHELQGEQYLLYELISDTRNRNFETVNYRGSNAITVLRLQGESLRKKNLSNTVLREALLLGADLEEADLSNSDLQGADLTCSNLIGTNFTDANLCECRFEDKSKIGSLRISPDGEFVAAGDNFGAVKIWKIKTGELYRYFKGHTKGVWALSWYQTSDHKLYIISGSLDKNVIIWDLEASSNKQVTMHDDDVSCVDCNSDKSLVVSGGGDGVIKVIKLPSGEVVWLQSIDEQIHCVKWSPDGKYIASTSGDRRITIWDFENRLRLTDIAGHQDTVWNVCWHPGSHNRLLVSGSQDTTIRIWNINGTEIDRFSYPFGHRGVVLNVAWSPDGKYISSSGGDTKVIVWDWVFRKILFIQNAHVADIWGLDWNASSNLLFSGSDDSTIKGWALKGKEEKSINQFPRCRELVFNSAKGLTSKIVDLLVTGGASSSYCPPWLSINTRDKC